MRIIARRDAIALGLSHYFTGKPCKHGHLCLRRVCGKCVDCEDQYNTMNVRRRRQASLQWQIDNAERAREIKRNDNRKHAVRRRETTSRWAKLNRHHVYSLNSARRTARLQATPFWLDDKDRQDIIEIYRQSQNFTESTGIKYHVDHIVPLKGEIVCGLHVPWNLQVLPGTINIAKHNKLCGDDDVIS